MDIVQSSEKLVKVFEYPFNETVLLLFFTCLMIGAHFVFKKLWVQLLVGVIGLSACMGMFVLYFHEISERNIASQNYGKEIVAELESTYDTDAVTLVTDNRDDSKDNRNEAISIQDPSSDLRSWASGTAHKFAFESSHNSLVEVKIDDEYYVYDLTKLGDNLTIVQKSSNTPSPMKFKKTRTL